MIDARPQWILGDLDLTWDGLGVLAASFDPGQSGGSSRTVALTVTVARPDLASMADVQAALDLECAKERNLLRYMPGEFGAPTRFVVGAPTVTTVADEDGERAGYRKVEISWPMDYFPTADEASLLSFAGGAAAVAVGGSRPASLSLAVTSATTLGTVLACTQPDLGVPWDPSLRQWTASPGSGSAVSAPSTFHSSQKWRASFAPTIPAGSQQAGPHNLVGRFYRASAGTETILWTGTGGQSYSTSVTWTSAGALIVPLGVLVLDPAAGDALFNLSFSVNVYVDDVFAVYAGKNSGMVVVDCGVNPSLWLDAPAVENDMRRSVTVGTARPGKSPGVGLLGASDLPLLPATARMFVASTNTQAPAVAASWLPAVQTHAVVTR